MNRQREMVWLAVLAGAALWATTPLRGRQNNDSMDGRTAFRKRCTGCHDLDHEKAGPRLAGVVGRKAGSVSTFSYSDGLKNSSLVWNEQLLDQWLSDPDSLIPENDMGFRLNSADERKVIIAFLKETGK